MKIVFWSFIFPAILISSCSDENSHVGSDSVMVSDDSVHSSVIHPILPYTQGSVRFDNISCGIVDHSGNLWFGAAREGLYKFNGFAFTQFTIADGLYTNFVQCLLEDQDGNIWIGTSDGICKYDGETISKVPIVVPDPSILINPDDRYGNETLSMLQDKSGKLWFCTSVGVFTYDGAKFSQFPNDYSVVNKDKLTLAMVDDILEDQKGNIWFASGIPIDGEGVCKYDGKSLISSKPNGDVWIRTITETQQGTIWFGGRHNGNFTYDGTDFAIFTAKEKIGSALLQDSKGNIWFSGEEDDDGITSVDGVWRYDGTNFTNFSTKDGLGDYGVWCIIEDPKGNIWFGTRNNGLYVFDGKTFTCYSE